MLHIEENQKPTQPIFIQGLGCYDKHETYYHMQLLEDAGFIEPAGNQSGMERSGIYAVIRVTNTGHDFIDAIREDNIWNKTKQKAGTYSLEIIKEVATSIIKQSLGFGG